ncbi:heme oxygenase (biliverdin-producing) [Janibacter sp. GXQ6167]|uniref:biliverdin-producing heme oxygenase n=1 Tax=Janibacter sp. GXQ6167 TaxID=3240791 RepID=UPI0035249ED6
MTVATDVLPLSRALKESTAAVHDEAEHSPFMGDLLAGRGSSANFIALTEQLWHIYDALERSIEATVDHHAITAVHDPRLARLAALEADLDHLSPGWRERADALPATRAYIERIQACADAPHRLLAHHYTRYLGDLSGGQVIPTLITRHYGVTDGLSFYDFEAIGRVKPYKDGYRAALDAIELSEGERAEVLDEAVAAFRANSALFAALA